MRRSRAIKRDIKPDDRFENSKISLLINNFMIGGKKSIATRICYKALEKASEITKIGVNEMFEIILKNVSPQKKVVPRRFGGSTYDIPREINETIRFKHGIKFIVQCLRSEVASKGKNSLEVLTNLLVLSYNGEGPAFDKKTQLHKKADDNLSFAHFKW